MNTIVISAKPASPAQKTGAGIQAGFITLCAPRSASRSAGLFSMDFEPKLIAMVCTYCTYTAADMAGSLRLQYPHNVRIIKYLCTGKVDIQHMLKAFEGGADALLVGG